MGPMSIHKITRILDAHSVPYQIDGSRILADSMEGDTKVFERLIDVTDWTFCRPPCGGRGLKCKLLAKSSWIIWSSPPLRGAWG